MHLLFIAADIRSHFRLPLPIGAGALDTPIGKHIAMLTLKEKSYKEMKRVSNSIPLESGNLWDASAPPKQDLFLQRSFLKILN
jgi:hypothetical protein